MPFDLDCPPFAAGEFQKQIDFGPSRGSIEARHGLWRGRIDQVFNGECFPAPTGYRVAQKRVAMVQIQQGVQDATVADLAIPLPGAFVV